MPRPKGSKNKPKNEPTEIEIEQADVEIEEEDAIEEEVVPFEDVDDEDTEDEGPPKIAPGLSRVAALPGAESELLLAIREQTATMTAAMPARKVLISQFKPRSSFNPTGKRRNLKVIVYQNGYRTNPKTLTDAEHELINSGKIRPGQYLSKVVTVRIEKAASAEDQDKIHIGYNNKTPDQRMMNKDLWNGFEDLVRKIIAESEARAVRIKARRRLEAAQ